MKAKIIRLIMFGFMVFSSLIFVLTLVDFAPQFTKSFGINEAYAKDKDKDKKKKKKKSVPEPSTLILLGTGLAAGGGIYSILKYRRRNNKK